MEDGVQWHGEPHSALTDSPGRPVEPRSGIEAALEWARAVGVRPGPMAAPRCTALIPLVGTWLEAQGYSVDVRREHIGHAFRVLGCRSGNGGVGVLGYRVPRALADSWWQAVGGRPKRVRKPKPPAPRVRKVPPLFHSPLSAARLGRPVVDSLGRVYPSACAAASMARDARGEPGNTKALGNALKASREGLAEWGRWRGLLWRYLTEAEVAAVPFGTRTGEVPPGWGFGPLQRVRKGRGQQPVGINRLHGGNETEGLPSVVAAPPAREAAEMLGGHCGIAGGQTHANAPTSDDGAVCGSVVCGGGT